MKYRHEQMIRQREQRKAPEPWRLVAAALWGGMTAQERRLWHSYSAAVAQVEPA